MKLTFFPRFAAEPARSPPPVRPQAEAGVRENLTMVVSTSLLLSDLGYDGCRTIPWSYLQDSALVCGHPNRTRLTLQLEQRALCASRAGLSLSGEALDCGTVSANASAYMLYTSCTWAACKRPGHLEIYCIVPTDFRWQKLFWLWVSDPGAASHVRECSCARRPYGFHSPRV